MPFGPIDNVSAPPGSTARFLIEQDGTNYGVPRAQMDAMIRGSGTVSAVAYLASTEPFINGENIRVLGYRAPGDGGGGTWYYDASDTTTTTNNVTVIVGPNDKRWKLLISKRRVNTRQLGAWNDGVSDDAATISSGMTLLPAGTRVYAPPEYVITAKSPLKIPGGIRFYGRRSSITVPDGFTLTDFVGVLTNRAWTTSGVDSYDVPTTLDDDLEIDGFVIDCNVAESVSETVTDRAQRGIFLYGTRRARIENVVVRNPVGGGIQLHYGCTDFEVRRNRLELRSGYTNPDRTLGAIRSGNMAGVLVASRGANGTAGVDMPGSNGFSPSMTLALAEPSTSKRGVIEANQVTGGTHGVLCFNADEITVRGNRLENNAHRGIILSPTCDENMIVENKVVDAGSTGIHLANGSSRNLIAGNIVRRTWHTEGDGIKAYVGCNDNTISNNKVYAAFRSGIRVAIGSWYNKVHGNTVDGAASDGSVPSGSRGITIESRDAASRRAVGNALHAAGASGYPTYAYETALYNDIRDNTVRSCESPYLATYELATEAPFLDDHLGQIEVRFNTWSNNRAINCTYRFAITAPGASVTCLTSKVYDNDLEAHTEDLAVNAWSTSAPLHASFRRFGQILDYPFARRITAGVHATIHSSSPEGAITAPIGSTCVNTANGKHYIKASGTGNTGWVVTGTQS